ncbi:MAG: hypothetical protein RLZ12_1038 [Bacillota bacterium]|jgi:fused signal recognition particle receptor
MCYDKIKSVISFKMRGNYIMSFLGQLTSKMTKKKQDKQKEKSRAVAQGLFKIKRSFFGKLGDFFSNARQLKESLYEELEELLILADVSTKTTCMLLQDLRHKAVQLKLKNTSELKDIFVNKLVELLCTAGEQKLAINSKGPTVYLFIGVNGVGKTTTIGKLAAQFKAQEKRVLLAAGDTFRAGAKEQLVSWGKRIDVDVIQHETGSDAAAVIFDAVQSAKKHNVDFLFCDTAGRLHNNANLMQELMKIERIIKRELPSAPHETLLVIDATMGQNVIQQTEMFAQSLSLTGLVLTKLDSSAKGGIVLSLSHELKIPVKLLGLGEKQCDLQSFDPVTFAQVLLEDLK